MNKHRTPRRRPMLNTLYFKQTLKVQANDLPTSQSLPQSCPTRSPTLDGTLGGAYSEAANVGKYGLALSAQDKADIIAFLKTLTDNEFITNPAHSNPF